MQNIPAWSFDDAYVDFSHEKFQNALKTLEDLINEVENLVKSDFCLLNLARLYEKCFDQTSSLSEFCKCKMSENTKNADANVNASKINAYDTRLKAVREVLFNALLKLDENDEFWKNENVDHFKVMCEDFKKGYESRLDPTQKEIFSRLESSNFTPLYGSFQKLNTFINAEVQNEKGESFKQDLAKCGGVLKGVADGVLRKSTYYALKDHYEKFAPLYVDLLNQLHGFRLQKINAANVDFRKPSFEQNKISIASVEAMYEALNVRIEKIRDLVRMRAKYFDANCVAPYDLLAPSPLSKAENISFSDSINKVREALSSASPEIGEFVDYMLNNRYFEAISRENKAGGAFYTRFNALKQPRVFTTFTGTFASMAQQAHELGHAWHYYIMRDLPSLKTEFPMSLTETASTFNEAILRDYLKKTSADNEYLFNILWQEIKAAADFMLHISARYDFELSFIKARKNAMVSKDEVDKFMDEAWQKWFGDSTSETESILPYFKLHFYKTDQYLYNYPYTIGYLLAQFLIKEFNQNKDFMTKYKAFLRDTGMLSVEDILKKHFDKDATKIDFWLECIDSALRYGEEFKEVERKLNIS